MEKNDLVKAKNTGILGVVDSAEDSFIRVILLTGSTIEAPSDFFEKTYTNFEERKMQ